MTYNMFGGTLNLRQSINRLHILICVMWLVQLWNSLQPDVALTGRISAQWTFIGFQGNDPATDFRGMGLLGLLNLL